MARVERYDSKIGDNKYGFVDSSNVLVIPPKFYYASWFSEGLVAVALNGKYGFIDQTGTWAIPPKYDEASSFDKTVALVNAQWQIRVYQYVRFLGHPFSIR